MSFRHAEVTETVIKAFYTVYNALGYGFLEKVYQSAMALELRKLGYEVASKTISLKSTFKPVFICVYLRPIN